MITAIEARDIALRAFESRKDAYFYELDKVKTAIEESIKQAASHGYRSYWHESPVQMHADIIKWLKSNGFSVKEAADLYASVPSYLQKSLYISWSEHSHLMEAESPTNSNG